MWVCHMENLDKIIITKIHNIFTVNHRKGYHTVMNNRPSYGLCFCTDGEVVFTLDGTQYISDTAHVVLMPQGATYDTVSEKGGSFPIINFTCDASFHTDTFIRFPVKNTESYLKDFERMVSLSLLENKQAKCMSILYDIISRLCKEERAEENLLAPTVDYMEKHYSDSLLNNRQLADLANMSEVYFRQMFRQIYQTTPKQYILELRIQKARQLLADGVLSITKVAELCGFASVYHFCRSFKGNTGMTPTEYRQLNQKNRL